MSERISPIVLHTKDKNLGAFIVYSVWNNKTDDIIIIDGTARDCAKAMGLSMSSFYSTVTKARKGKNKKWAILSRYVDGKKRVTKAVRK